MNYYDLGAYSRTMTTTSPETQLWFDRGLIWTYGYHHEEAITCFEKALASDKNCAMAHWGIAYAIGPNYNKPWDAFEEDEKPECIRIAQQAVEQATKLSSGVTGWVPTIPLYQNLISGTIALQTPCARFTRYIMMISTSVACLSRQS